ncbi:MAG: LysM peptidoglycan-binding domain-containing protein [Planctomycetota bacterium]|nr:LysM peptidoglycan-binding domain-containing protein [Planctomycetota bacterium]MDA1214062.1 LysM peptidoglycan-binding domain-containing protein [Planctomycetota bacterium]
MPNDQKVGFALGLLLLGIVAAFFFRHPPMDKSDVPTLESSAEVDAQISEKEVTPYLSGIETDRDDVSGPTPVDGRHLASGEARSRREAPQWEVPDFLKRNTSGENGNRISNPEKIAPDPIPLVSDTTNSKLSSPSNSRTLKYVPEHNNAWETVPPIPLPNDSGTASKNPAPSDAPRAAAPENHKTYVVQSGDTLSGIAQKQLGSSGRFEDIYEANRDLLKNPNDLRVGMKLKIPPRERSTEINSLPIDGPSASAAASSRKPFTRAAIRTPEGNPLKSSPSTSTEASSAADENTNNDNATPSATPGPAAPRGRFAPARRSPYRPISDPEQSSIDRVKPLDLVRQSAAQHKPGKKVLTQIPPKDLPLDVEIQSEAETATRDGEFTRPVDTVK